jgi:hypothetical protein
MHSTPRIVAAWVLAGTLVLAACGGGGGDEASPTTTTTTAKARPVIAPLTGLADAKGVTRTRCAVTVKVDNTQQEGRKAGVEAADVVYEEVVEGGITRLAAVFHSRAPVRVGPVRSVRKTDQSLVWPLRGIFAYSGGAQYALDSIDTAPVVQLDETRAGSMMARDRSRRAPYNLFAAVDQMYGRCEDPAPTPLFAYRGSGAAVAGDAVSSVVVGFRAGFAVTWTWDSTSRSWKRSIFGRPEEVESGVQLAAANVVVMFVEYEGGNASGLGAEAALTGTGPAWVFTGGKVVKGTWARADKAQPARLADPAGAVIRLAPGTTWVELPDASYAVDITAPPPPAVTTSSVPAAP